MGPVGSDAGGHSEPDRLPEGNWDAALARLEDVLLAYPFDRALPDLHAILEAAQVSETFLREDDRALKVLHEAIVARPLSSIDAVTRVRTEVELLTLEVEVLTDRLLDPHAPADQIDRSTARLVEVRRALGRVRGML